jgi:hypothetical protein
VDWINYIYYNQQRFNNYTRNAVRGTAEQLSPTSKIACKNQMALDMILAEKRGVCMLYIHPQQHSSRWDHNQGSPRPDSPVKQTG